MIAYVFPGQGSQKPGMGLRLHDESEAARAVFAQASEGAGRDLRTLLATTDDNNLRGTDNAQPALYVTSVAAAAALGGTPDVLAGHSVGEFAALAVAGIVSVEDGARLVQTRGNLMARAGEEVPGTMAAILGLDRDPLQAVLDGIDGVVVIANDNCPGQLVISGEVAAVEAACVAAKEAGAKRALPLSVSGAFHSPLMEASAAEFRKALDTVEFRPGRPVIANVTADVVTDPADWPELLERQLRSPVRWTETVRTMRRMGVTEAVELGIGEVLSGLFKRTEPEIATRSYGA